MPGPIFFQMFQIEKPIYLNIIGQNSITKKYGSVDWPHTLKLQNNNIDASLQNFLDYMKNILQKHTPLKRLPLTKIQLCTKDGFRI